MGRKRRRMEIWCVSLTSQITPVVGYVSSKSCLKNTQELTAFSRRLGSPASSQQDWVQHGAQLTSPAELNNSAFVERVASNEGVHCCVGSTHRGWGLPGFRPVSAYLMHEDTDDLRCRSSHCYLGSSPCH